MTYFVLNRMFFLTLRNKFRNINCAKSMKIIKVYCNYMDFIKTSYWCHYGFNGTDLMRLQN